jgi:hypothetical protein
MMERPEMIKLLTEAQSAGRDRTKELLRQLSQLGPGAIPVLVDIVDSPPASFTSDDLLSNYILVENADIPLWDLVSANPQAYIAWAADRLDSEAVVRHLSRLDGPVVDDLLLDALRTGSQGRGHAAQALGERRDGRALPYLVALLEDPGESSFSAVRALHVLADRSAEAALERYATTSAAAGSFGAENVARHTLRWLNGQARPPSGLEWFVAPHAADDEQVEKATWRNAAIVAAFDVLDAHTVIVETWAQIRTSQPAPVGTPSAYSGTALRDLGFPVRPGWPLERGMEAPFSIKLDLPEETDD